MMKINKRSIFLIVLLVGALFLFAKTAFSVESGNEFKLRQEIIKFVPYKELGNLFAQQTKLVYMSYQELKKLIAEKSRPEPPAPVDYVIKNISLNGTIKDDYISFEGDYKIDLINKNWAQIPVLSINTGLKQAVFDEKPAKLVTDNMFFRVISDEVGGHSLKLKFDVKGTKFGNNNTVTFSIPNVSIADINVAQPSNASDLSVNNVNGRVEVKWKTASGKVLPVAHKTKKEKVNTKPAKIVANANTLISIDEGLLQGFSSYALRVYHNSIEKLTFQIPEDIEILDVSSPQNIVNKGSHKVEGNTLTVYLNSRVSEQANLNIIYEKTFENKKTDLAVPNIYPLGEEISKVSGYVAVQTAGNSEIKTVKAENISRIDISDLPPELERVAEYPIIAAYSFLKNDYSLALVVTPHKDAPVQVAVADQMRADSRLSPNGILTSKIEYTVRNMSEQFFRFNLPENAEILSAAINNIPQQVEKQDSEGIKNPIYLVNIKKHQDTGPFNLVVMYRQKLQADKLANIFDLRLPRILNMPVLTLSWTVYVPDSLKYWSFTDLNKGSYNYLRYLPQQSRGYAENKGRVRTQIASNYVLDGSCEADSNKVAGILPPEFSMPPTKGLKRFNFSGYLTGAEFIDVTMFSIAGFFYYLLIFTIAYYVWKNRLYLIDKLRKIVQR